MSKPTTILFCGMLVPWVAASEPPPAVDAGTAAARRATTTVPSAPAKVAPPPADGAASLTSVGPSPAATGASTWHDFWPKLLLSVVDKTGLGIIALLFGYCLQRRLELHKRNDALAVEIAKVHAAAFTRLSAAAGEILRDVVLTFTSNEPPPKEKVRSAARMLREACLVDWHLVGSGFEQELRAYTFAVEHFIETASGGASDEDLEKLFEPIGTYLRRMSDSQPQFVRLPEGDRVFHLPPTPRREAHDGK